MKKTYLFLAMCIATILSANGQTSVWDGSHTAWTKGDGTQANPYLIENAAQLAQLAYVVNNGIGAANRIVGANTYWKLTTNIDLKGSDSFQWTPIGYNYRFSDDYYAFGGNFDGNGKTISNLFINTTTLQSIGLFGYTDGASVKGIGIIGNSSVTGEGTAGAGGIAGYSYNTYFDNCYNTGNISSPAGGGIVGAAYDNTTINNCYNIGNISSFTSGGIAGATDNTTINNCHNTGTISSKSYTGGIVGFVGSSGSTIINCYNTGGIFSSSSESCVKSGGIIGVARASTIINCYNTGNVFSSSTSSFHLPYSAVSGGIVGDCNEANGHTQW